MTSGPRIACEITADRVLAARASEDVSKENYVEVYSARTLPTGAVTPGLAGSNVQDPGAVRNAIAGALQSVGGRSRDLIAILPDAAIRVALLDFETLPPRPEDADALVRFRLKKSLPFDVERAAVSYDALRRNGSIRVVAAVAPAQVVEEYESLFRDEGYSPGVVLPSMLAALGNVSGDRPTMVAKVNVSTIALAIVEGQELRLLRTVENPVGAGLTGEQLAAEVYPSLVFFEDTYGAKVERILLAGIVPLEQVLGALESQTEVRVHELVTGRYLGQGFGESTPRGLLAGVVGALVA